ncbi:terpenoid synthase [Thozetella sp. PMI_491]|nr:terpenoid synthase [Thozetella sp. PMI_491]
MGFTKISINQVLYIPDTLASWPWPRACNPNYEICKQESSVWLESFHAFSPKAQKAFNRCDFPLLAALAYPTLNRAGCRIGADLMNVFFVFDEWSDVSDEKECRRQADIIMDALRNPHKSREEGEWVGGRAVQEFWLNAIETATRTAQQRFIDSFERYTNAVVQQARDREDDCIRDIENYFSIRRLTIGAEPSFAINAVHYDIPDSIINHPTIQFLTTLCIDMLLIGNDLVSYNVEQSRGDDGHNLVTVVMLEHNMNPQDAMDWIGDLHTSLVEQFLAEHARLPIFYNEDGTVNQQVPLYVDALGNWVRANDSWSFESERYFAKDGERVRRERTVALLPKKGVEIEITGPQISLGQTAVAVRK